ncbi:polyketide synthase, partial [Diaporthe sp. PMI_573]
MPTSREVAIVGLACQLPCAESPDEFWELLSKHPATAFGRVPRDRFNMSAWLDPTGRQRGKSYTDAGSFMRDADLFDHETFGLPAFEAASMDPQQRLLLQVCLRAFADAGLDRSAIRGANIGVYVGAMNFDAAFGAVESQGQQQQPKSASSAAPSLLSSRLSHVFGLQGPSVTIDTACSSSLVAMESGVEALRSGKIDYALVASANCISSPRTYVSESAAGMLSRQGACVPFDDQADGFVRGEGVVAVVLQRLDAAEMMQASSQIHAVVSGIATNHSGRTAANLTSPSPSAQAAVIRAALSDAQVEPGRVSYVEAHGTGTKLGDPLEFNALQDVFDASMVNVSSTQWQALYVGAVKANVGHLESAAGLAGILKTVLVLKHGRVPPLSHVTENNRHLQLNRGSRVVLPKRWESLPSQGGVDGVVAGVSSFGFSGVNCHVILRPGS